MRVDSSGAFSQLDFWMNERRLELGLDWQQVADAAGITRQALLDIRKGGNMRSKTEHALEAALHWSRGSISAIRKPDGQPTKIENRVEQATASEPGGTDSRADVDSPEFWESLRRNVSEKDYRELWTIYQERKALLAERDHQLRRTIAQSSGSEASG